MKSELERLVERVKSGTAISKKDLTRVLLSIYRDQFEAISSLQLLLDMLYLSITIIVLTSNDDHIPIR